MQQIRGESFYPEHKIQDRVGEENLKDNQISEIASVVIPKSTDAISSSGHAKIKNPIKIIQQACSRLLNAIGVRAGITDSFRLNAVKKRDEEGLQKLRVLNPEEFTFDSGGNKLEGMYFESLAKTQNSKTILICSGSGDSHEFFTQSMVKPLLKMGHNVMVFNYSGFGGSEGEPTEPQILKDGQAAFNHLTEQKKIPPEKVVVWGYSMGSGPAVEVAKDNPRVSLVLDRAISSYYDVVCKEVKGLPKPFRKLFEAIAKRLDYFNNMAKIGDVKGKVIVFQEDENEDFGDKLAGKRPNAQLHKMQMPHISGENVWYDEEVAGGLKYSDGTPFYQNMETEQAALKTFLNASTVGEG